MTGKETSSKLAEVLHLQVAKEKGSMDKQPSGAPMEAADVATDDDVKEIAKTESTAAKKSWSANQVHKLINIWQEVPVSLGHGNLRGIDMDRITTRYNSSSGDTATKAQVESKIASLKKTYQNQLRLKGSTGRGPRKAWEFFEAIDAFMGFKPKATGIPGHQDSGVTLKAKKQASSTLPSASKEEGVTLEAVKIPTSIASRSKVPSPFVSPAQSAVERAEGQSSTPQASAPPSTPMQHVSPENSRDEPVDVAAKEMPAAVNSKLPEGVQGKRTAAGEATATLAKKSKARRHSAGGSGPAIAKALEGLAAKMDDREDRREKQRREDKKADKEFKKDMMRMQMQHQEMMAGILLGGAQQQQPLNEPPGRDDEGSDEGSKQDSFEDKED